MGMSSPTTTVGYAPSNDVLSYKDTEYSTVGEGLTTMAVFRALSDINRKSKFKFKISLKNVGGTTTYCIILIDATVVKTITETGAAYVAHEEDVTLLLIKKESEITFKLYQIGAGVGWGKLIKICGTQSPITLIT